MAINKIIYGGKVLIDLSGTTATPDKVLLGFTYLDAAGVEREGTCAFDLDTGDATLKVAEALEGKTFVVTGSVFQFKNRNELKAYIEERGGKVAGSVSKNTDYLINNDNMSSSSKNKTAKELGIPIITEEEFLALVK